MLHPSIAVNTDETILILRCLLFNWKNLVQVRPFSLEAASVAEGSALVLRNLTTGAELDENTVSNY